MGNKTLSAVLATLLLSGMLIAASCAQPSTTTAPSPTTSGSALKPSTPQVSPAAAPKPSRPFEIVRMLTTQFGTKSYIESFAVEQVAAKYHPWLRIAAVETPGTIYDIQELEKVRGKAEAKKIIIVNGWHGIQLTRNGIMIPGQKLCLNDKVLLSTSLIWFVYVTFDSNIKTADDAAGKKVAIGQQTQSAWGQVHVQYWQKGPKNFDKLKISYPGTTAAMGYLRDGSIDVALSGGYCGLKNGKPYKITLNNELIELEGAGKPPYYVDLKTDYINRAIQDGLPEVLLNLPAGTLPNQKADLTTMAMLGGWSCDSSVTDETAYEFVNLYLDHLQDLVQYSDQLALYTPETMITGVPVAELHPGAAKAYREYAQKHPEDTGFANAAKQTGLLK